MLEFQVSRKRCPYCNYQFNSAEIAPATGMRVIKVLTFYDSDGIQIAGLLAAAKWVDVGHAAIAASYRCPGCSLVIWEASPSVPSWLRSDVNEALLCLKTRAYTAMAIMCRKIVEQITSAHGAKGTLKSRLESLVKKKLLAGAPVIWMEQARQVGNLGAHSIGFDTEDEENAGIILLALAIIQAAYVEKPNEFKDKYGNWTTSWEIESQ